jgi:hypothetical protein
MNTFYESYKTLPSKSLKAMLVYEGKVDGQSSDRYDAVRQLLRQKRMFGFRISRHEYVDKLL